ncbi:mesothelin [Labeo rohita]|uniref:Mesothelin n=1 Tax=Labeo rohita TaxID=84645 RepID=A0A498LSQ5_LABRO|nr:mesothelin [Labeo rohita]
MLESLDTLPLYFTGDFWSRFSAPTKRKYLKVFMPLLRTRNTEKPKLKKLFKNCNAVLDAQSRIRRSADCTAGNITEATIADASFPFGYTAAQFDACLTVRVLRDNLAAVTEKVDDSDFQRIILRKLKQVYPAGLSDSALQLLASVSRQATLDEIRTWNVTSIDTLTALMDHNNGEWDKDKSKEVILRYLSVTGHTLGSNELNVIGSNICALNISTLQSITAGDLSNAEVLDLSSCSYEQKSVLYVTANSSFRAQRSNGPIYFHLISPYLGKTHLRTYHGLSVSDVRALMGSAVGDLKVFENDSVVQAWIASQPQSQLDTLNVGLYGGRADPSAPAPTPVTVQSNSTANSTGSVMSTAPGQSSVATVTAQGKEICPHENASYFPAPVYGSDGFWPRMFSSAELDGPTQSFLMCAGVPSEPDADHVLHLKGLISAALDVYSFMRSSVAGVPVVDLSGGFDMTEDHVIKAWLDIKLTPLLSSISRNFLTCLSNRNFSCSAYQTVYDNTHTRI